MRRIRRSLLPFLFIILFFSSGTHAENDQTVKTAFIRDGYLWIKSGNNEVQATKEKGIKNPIWSSDGKWIAYFKNDEIWAYDVRQHKHYQVYHTRSQQLKWAPDKNILAFQDDQILNVSDFQSGKPEGFRNVTSGVGNFSWLPNGNGFMISSIANLLPDGWTQPILYQVSLTGTINRFFEIPGILTKDHVQVLSIGTSSFRWSSNQRWISFIVHPTASLSADSNMLCVLSADGKIFQPLDEMLNHEQWFKWAPNQNLLGYIQGSGRSATQNKHLKVKALTGLQTPRLTPNGFADQDFTWINDQIITVSRMEESGVEVSNHPLPALFQVLIDDSSRKQITYPPPQFGDYNPQFLRNSDKLAWIRTNEKEADVWMSKSDGSDAHIWIENIDLASNYYGQWDWDQVLSWNLEDDR